MKWWLEDNAECWTWNFLKEICVTFETICVDWKIDWACKIDKSVNFSYDNK